MRTTEDIATWTWSSERLEAEDELAVFELFVERNWSDGLPVIVPTPERVERMFDCIDWQPDQSLGTMPPRDGAVTIEKLAINAVAAGCKPEYMPALIAATQAILEAQFNLSGVQTTGNPCTPLYVFSGPLIRDLELNYSFNVFGSGNRANATIGRAMNLIRITLGGAISGEVDKATHGHPGKYTYCFAEHPDESPWEPHHVTMGYDPEATTVTVIAGEGPTRVVDEGEGGPRAILRTFADGMSRLGTNKLYWPKGEFGVLFGPTHAEMLATRGFSKWDVQMSLFENARRTIRDIKGPYGTAGIYPKRIWPKWIDDEDPDQRVPVVRTPEDILVWVAGGYTISGAVIPTWGAADRAVRPLTNAKGELLRGIERHPAN